MRRLALLVATLALPLAASAQSVIIGTRAGTGQFGPGAMPGSLSIGGDMGFLAIGQTFVVPAGASVLTTFSLWTYWAPAGARFQAFLAPYTGNASFNINGPTGGLQTGAPVWSSDVLTLDAQTERDGPRRLDFAVNTPVVAGTSTASAFRAANYLFYVTALGLNAPGVEIGWATRGDQNSSTGMGIDRYASGTMTVLCEYCPPYGFFPPTTIAGIRSNSRWDQSFATVIRDDLAFQATFATVPEPSTWALVATGAGVLGVVARRRRR